MVRITLAAFFTVAFVAWGCSSNKSQESNPLMPNPVVENTKNDAGVQGENGNGANVFEQTLSTNVKNKCTNQNIRMVLEFKIVETEGDNNGKMHDGRHVVLKGYGESSNGTEYYLHTNMNTVLNMDGDSCPYSETMLTNSHLKIKNGDGVEYKFLVRYHVTYNANCEPTVEIDEVDLDCDN